MGGKVSRNDYEWVSTDEPHATRRALILAKYPEIKQLMKVDPNFKWTVLLMVFIQIISYNLLRNTTSFWVLFVTGYFFNGVINHILLVTIHEISHNQAFGPSRPFANKLLGIIANLPIGVPLYGTYKKDHTVHHRVLHIDRMDMEVPSEWEAKIFTTTARKLIWVILLPFILILRSLNCPNSPNGLEFTNIVIQFLFDFIIGKTIGWNVVAYMIGSSLLTLGLHPMIGHSIGDHYLMFKKSKESIEKYQKEYPFVNGVNIKNGEMLIQETFSYYGPLNAITFNVGYHVEHHDFPSIPGKLLPEVRKIAPEFYECLYSHNSWIYVVWKFITDPDMGPYGHSKRRQKSDNLLKNI